MLLSLDRGLFVVSCSAGIGSCMALSSCDEEVKLNLRNERSQPPPSAMKQGNRVMAQMHWRDLPSLKETSTAAHVLRCPRMRMQASPVHVVLESNCLVWQNVHLKQLSREPSDCTLTTAASSTIGEMGRLSPSKQAAQRSPFGSAFRTARSP